MSSPYIGEVRIWANNFAPRDWAFCDGQLLQIAQFTALFSILGTTYGGNGETNFGLPDLMGRAPMGAGTGIGLTPRPLGAKSGAETVALGANQLPKHSHDLMARATDAVATTPGGGVLANTPENSYDPAGLPVPMPPNAVATTGTGAAHNNMQPYLTLHFCIALNGVYPTPS